MAPEVKIGLETHVELLTESKIFCSCKNSFGDAPNTNCCEICTGMPGAMPSLNKKVIELALRAGLALDCEISPVSVMARKNYVYPDLSKAYQITQSSRPLLKNGKVTLPSGREIRIERIHIEEDAGKLKHKDKKAFIDYNRAGVPLIEIVTYPDFKSGREVREYLNCLGLTMRKLGISDCKMQEGSLRCDINISLKEGDRQFERTEIKNVNSYSYCEKAVDYEIRRQMKIISGGGAILRETRRYDSKKDITEPMRKKEGQGDYRYFDEPDIPLIYIPEELILKLQGSLKTTAFTKMRSYMDMGLSYEEAFGILKYPHAEEYFDSLLNETGDADFALRIIYNYVFAALSEEERENEIKPDVKEILYVKGLIKERKVKREAEKTIFTKMFEMKKGFPELFSLNDFSDISKDDTRELALKVIRENEKAVCDYKSGKEKALYFLAGSVMKLSGRKADIITVKEALKEIIDKS